MYDDTKEIEEMDRDQGRSCGQIQAERGWSPWRRDIEMMEYK